MRYATAKIVSLVRQAARAEDKPITLMFFATGVVITFLQYQEFLDTKRVETSYRHVEEWETGAYKSAFDQVSLAIRRLEQEALEVVPEDFQGEELERAQLSYTQNRLADLADQDLGQNLDRLIYYFDKLSVCVDRSLCDGDLLESFFKDNLSRLWIYSSSFIAKRRGEIDGYGALTQFYLDQLNRPQAQSIWDRWTG